MNPRIHVVNLPTRKIRDTSRKMARVDVATVAAALGADPAMPVATLEINASPLSVLMLRAELAERLASSGGRPGLAGASRRQKIPLGDEDWARLEALAEQLTAPGLRPSPGQVAGALLSSALRVLGDNRELAAQPSNSYPGTPAPDLSA